MESFRFIAMEAFRFIAKEDIPAGNYVALDATTGKVMVARNGDRLIGTTLEDIYEDDRVVVTRSGRVKPDNDISTVAHHVAVKAPISDEDARRVMSGVIELLAQGVSPDRLIDELKRIRNQA